MRGQPLYRSSPYQDEAVQNAWRGDALRNCDSLVKINRKIQRFGDMLKRFDILCWLQLLDDDVFSSIFVEKMPSYWVVAKTVMVAQMEKRWGNNKANNRRKNRSNAKNRLFKIKGWKLDPQTEVTLRSSTLSAMYYTKHGNRMPNNENSRFTFRIYCRMPLSNVGILIPRFNWHCEFILSRSFRSPYASAKAAACRKIEKRWLSF